MIKKIINIKKRINLILDKKHNYIYSKGFFGDYLLKNFNIQIINNYVFFPLNKNIRNCFLKYLNFLLKSLYFGWFLELKIEGWNYYWQKQWINKILKIHLGYSHDIGIKFPKNVFFRNKKRKLFLFSSNLYLLKFFALLIKNIRFMTSYKLKGILFFNEDIKLKSGKKEKFF